MPAPKGRARVEAPAPPRVTYLVKRLELAIRSEMDAIVGDFGVTALQYTALSVLDRHPGMSGAQLARRSFVSPQAGSEMVGVLERKGLISRSPHEANRRVLRIGLTPAGRELLAACDEAIDDLERRMLDGLAESRVHGLRTDLASCVDALSRHVRGAGRWDRLDGRLPTAGSGRVGGAGSVGNGTGPRPRPRAGQKG